jgi:hypothetical protein
MSGDREQTMFYYWPLLLKSQYRPFVLSFSMYVFTWIGYKLNVYILCEKFDRFLILVLHSSQVRPKFQI